MQMNTIKKEEKNIEEEYYEPFSESVDSLEYKKEKRVYSLCTYFLPILIIILILSIVIYFFLKRTNIKQNEENLNYTIKEKIKVLKNDSRPILLFNDHFTNIIKNITSIKINNKLIDEIENYYKFNCIGEYLVEITFNRKLESMQELFNYCEDIIELDLSDIDTSQVKSMKSAFNGCNNLTSINLDNFNTSLVTDMSYMFSDCYSLTSLNLNNFNTELVKDMSYMFSNMSSLNYLNISGFNTKNVYKMQHMFYLSNLTSLDVSNFNTEKVIYIHYMFSNCRFLTSLNLSNFNTKEVVDFRGLFKGDESLIDIDIRNFYTTKMNSYKDIFEQLPESGNITINLDITSAMILNQIPENWMKKKISNH